MRIDGSIEKVPVLVAIGVTETGQKLVLGFQAGDKESAPTWREFFKDLKKRSLDGSKVVLVKGIKGDVGSKTICQRSIKGTGFLYAKTTQT